MRKIRTSAILASISYGILSILGGIWGYIKAKSQASLISGCLSGILLLFAAWMQLQEYDWGSVLAKAVTLLLIAVFSVRLAKTRKLMPSGLMLVAGAITLSRGMLSSQAAPVKGAVPMTFYSFD